MVLFENKNQCYGCFACVNACNFSAIEMCPDEEGFLYPVISEDKCTNCGACKKVCQIHNKPAKNTNISAYAARHKSKDVVGNSASGGAFTAISDSALTDGTVYGAAFDASNKVVHTKAEAEEQRNLMRTSKYVQSEIGKAYSQIKSALDKDENVMFTGTPCQAAGLKCFLGKEYKNLLICDLICHGVGSPLIWQEYLKHSEKVYGATITGVKCRDPKFGWHKYVTTFRAGDKEIADREYIKIYSCGVAMRPSCHRCEYTDVNRVSDITIGDFWGIKNVSPEFYDDMGVSVMLINTNKGEVMFEKIKNDLNFSKHPISDCLQPNLQKPTQPNVKRSKFWKDYSKKGFAYVQDKYFGKRAARRAKLVGIIKKAGIGKLLGR